MTVEIHQGDVLFPFFDFNIKNAGLEYAPVAEKKFIQFVRESVGEPAEFLNVAFVLFHEQVFLIDYVIDKTGNYDIIAVQSIFPIDIDTDIGRAESGAIERGTIDHLETAAQIEAEEDAASFAEMEREDREDL